MRWWTQEARATGEAGAHIRVQQRLGELVRAHYLAFARLQMPAPHANDCGAGPRHRQGSRSLCVCSRRQILSLLSESHMSWAMFCDGLEADLRRNWSIAIDEGSSGACRGRSRAHGEPVSGGRRRGRARARAGPCFSAMSGGGRAVLGRVARCGRGRTLCAWPALDAQPWEKPPLDAASRKGRPTNVRIGGA